MALTVRELVEIPHLASRVHAGRGGLDREIHFASTCEMPDPWEWLSEGDLLLTSGLGLPGRPAGQAQYVRQLSRAGISGLSIGEPIDSPPISDEMVRMADRMRLPVLVTAYDVPFTALSRAVVDANAGEAQERLRQIARLYDRVRLATAAGDSAETLLRALGDEVHCRLIVYDNLRGRRLLVDSSAGGTPGAPDPLRDALREALDDHGGRMPAAVHLAGDDAALVVPVPSTRPASLVLVRESDVELPDVALLQHVATVIALELERSEANRAEAIRRSGEVLAEMLDAPMDAPVARYRLSAHGIDGTRLVLAAWGPQDALHPDVLHDALVDTGTPHLLLRREQKTVTLSSADVELAVLASLLPPATRAGVSTPFTHPSQASDALRQAGWALQAASEGNRWLVRYGEDHAPFLPRTLAEARAAVERVLGPLLAYDREHSTELVHTLRVFLQSDRSWKRSAELLFIHKQTLVYRIRRIEEVIGRRLAETQNVADVWFALRALDLSGGHDPD